MHCGGTAIAGTALISVSSNAPTLRMITGMKISLLDKGAVVKTIERFRQKIEGRGVTAQKIIKKVSFSSFLN